MRTITLDASWQQQTSFAAAVSARLDEMRRGVDADLAAHGTGIADRYRAQRADALQRGDWSLFKKVDDKLTYLQSVARSPA
ncbi:hypothetical protein [Pyruvatibacter sp.]|uniref:hypothetical protein n=1 Tax=Pyruvatibacter sp. TaxID=1981328 RepID=UPI0032EDD327